MLLVGSTAGQSFTEKLAEINRERMVLAQMALDIYFNENGRSPRSWEELLEPNKAGSRTLTEIPRDAWRRKLHLVPSLLQGHTKVALSNGPDGKPGTADDVDAELLRMQPSTALYALTDLDGKRLDHKLIDGRVVIVHFWSGACLQEAGVLTEIASIAKGHPDEVSVLAIASHHPEIGDEPADWAGFAAKEDAERPYSELRAAAKQQGLGVVLVDHRGLAARFFKARTTTHCVVLDRKTQVAYSGAALMPGAKDEPPRRIMREAVEALLADKQASTLQPPATGMPLELKERIIAK
jgi:hypothetical protein